VDNAPKTLVTPDYQLVAKVGLSVGISGLVGVLFVLWIIGDRAANGYGEVISATGTLKHALAPAIWLFGLAMLSIAGVTTWLFSLYASFRVAGPLFRIARDIEEQIKHSGAKPIPIRTTDKLQAEWVSFEAGVAGLRAHREQMGLSLNTLQQWSDDPHTNTDLALAQSALARLSEVEQRVTL
jgi:hypothetical protein